VVPVTAGLPDGADSVPAAACDAAGDAVDRQPAVNKSAMRANPIMKNLGYLGNIEFDYTRKFRQKRKKILFTNLII